MNKIQTIMNDLSIPDKKKALMERKQLTSDIKHVMSELSFNRPVAVYAYNLDLIEYAEDEETVEDAILENVMLVHTDPNVEKYDSLRRELDRFNAEAYDYYRCLQTDLRDALLEINLPEIYVYQGLIGKGELKSCRHLIIPGTFQVIRNDSDVERVIYPDKPTESRRKLNSFYNRTSLRYLDGMTEDYSFSLEGKNLGRVK